MKPNTAVGLLLAGLALTLAGPARRGRWRVPLRRAAAAGAAAIGAATTAQYAGGFDLGIDTLLFAPRPDALPTPLPPNRMSLATALDLMAIGGALLLVRSAGDTPRRMAEALAALVILTAYLALLGYLYSATSLYAVYPFASVSLPTAVSFLLLGLGTLAARPDRGLARLIASPHAGGLLARRLLPLAVIVPAVIGWIRLEGQRLGLFGTEFGIMLLVGANSAVFVAVIVWNVISLDHADRRRRQVDLVRRLNAALDARVGELAAVNKELEAFSYSVSHDLRAPLRAIDGFSRILIEDHAGRLPPDGQRLLGIVRRNTQQMGRLIDDLLAYSRLGRAPLKTEAVALDELVQRTIAELRPEYEGRRVEFSVGPLGTVQADPALLKQVLVNLIGNAVKFTRKCEEARIEIGIAPAPSGTGAPIYFVRDNGAGFDMRYADKLFQVFQRMHRAEDYEGTGVGLAIVDRVVRRHGGRVWAEAEPGRGATFHFVLRGETFDER